MEKLIKTSYNWYCKPENLTGILVFNHREEVWMHMVDFDTIADYGSSFRGRWRVKLKNRV